MCNVAEVITVEIAPTPTPLAWPGVLKYTVTDTLEGKRPADGLCASIKDKRTWTYLKPETMEPVVPSCKSVEFGF
jgi:hypothetical protein